MKRLSNMTAEELSKLKELLFIGGLGEMAKCRMIAITLGGKKKKGHLAFDHGGLQISLLVEKDLTAISRLDKVYFKGNLVVDRPNKLFVPGRWTTIIDRLYRRVIELELEKVYAHDRKCREDLASQLKRTPDNLPQPVEE